MERTNFADVLTEQIRCKHSQVVVGLDPRLDRLPAGLRPSPADRLDPAAAAEAIVAFNRAVVDAVSAHAVAVKSQVAFYEEWGCEGMRAYADSLRYARERGLVAIGDVKRGDVASTAEAYAAAHLGGTDGASAPDFIADAVTLNPYLGSDGVRPFLEAAAANGRGVFVLVKTSNPSSAELQDLDCGGALLYERVAGLVAQWGEPYLGESGYSLAGAVVGATYPQELARLRGLMPHAPFLVPGFGAQGGGVQDVLGAFDERGEGAVVNSSRGIIFAWRREPYATSHGEARWQEAVRAAAADMQERIWQATH